MAKDKGTSKGKGTTSKGGTDAKSAKVTLTNPQQKKSVVRFDYDGSDDNPAVRTVYIDNATVAKLGNPESVRITIEAA